jgi:hypothetical protein
MGAQWTNPPIPSRYETAATNRISEKGSPENVISERGTCFPTSYVRKNDRSSDSPRQDREFLR